LIGRGIIKADDHIRFGKTVDELSKIAYTVMYVSKSDQLVVCLHKNRVEELKKKFDNKVIDVIVPKKGVLAFAKIRWR